MYRMEINMKKLNAKHYINIFIAISVLVFIDQITKVLAVRFLKDIKEFPLIKNIFVLEYLENRGAAFGMLQGKQFFFFFSFVILAILVLIFFFKVPATKRYLPLTICVIFISAGAIGNSIDRIRNQFVVDFFYFKPINFPVFNVADIYVTLATIALILLILFYYKEEDFDKLLSRRK